MRSEVKIVWAVILMSMFHVTAMAGTSENYTLYQTVINSVGNSCAGSGREVLNSVGEPLAGQTWGKAFSIQSGFFNDYYALPPTPTVTCTPIRTFGGELLNEDWVYAAPNPIRGRQGTIYFDLAEPAEVDLKIYTTMNQLVMSQHWASMTPGHNQWVWNAENMANGVYLLHIKANKDGKTTIIKKKIALIK